MDFNGFLWFVMDLTSSGTRMSAARWHPQDPCAGLCRPTATDWIPLILLVRFQTLEAWI